jgi:hypothetical protein
MSWRDPVVGGDAFVCALRGPWQTPQDLLRVFWIAQGYNGLLRHVAQTLIGTDTVIAHPPGAEVENDGTL